MTLQATDTVQTLIIEMHSRGFKCAGIPKRWRKHTLAQLHGIVFRLRESRLGPPTPDPIIAAMAALGFDHEWAYCAGLKCGVEFCR